MSNELAQRLFGTPGNMALAVLGVMIALLLAAAWTDLRHQRIPNRLVFPGTALALVLHASLPAGDGLLSALPGALGFAAAVTGLAYGLLALLPFYCLRAMGAGDVKLMAMVGAFVGPTEIWWALFYTALAGGVLALGMILRHALLARVVQNLQLMVWNFLFALGGHGVASAAPSPNGSPPLPYGVAIAAGSIALVIHRL